MPATLKDVAQKSGYSVTTVSRALTGYDDVNAETRQHIREVADSLGYQPNHSARQLQGQRTQTIGLVMPPPVHMRDDDFFSLLLKGITYEAARNGYDVLTSAAYTDDSELDVYRRIVGGKRVDGMVVARTYRDDQRIAYLQSVHCPFIVSGRSAPGNESNFHYIDADSQNGIYAMTAHVISKEHEHIACILPGERYAFTSYRLAGYKAALSEYNILFREAYCVYGDLSYESGKQATQQLLEQFPELTAIIGCNDWMALGAMAAASELGRVIGEDFIVTGYDDIPAGAYATPGLTTVRQPIYTIGEQLVQQLLNIIDDDPTTYYQHLIAPELIIRGSSGG